MGEYALGIWNFNWGNRNYIYVVKQKTEGAFAFPFLLPGRAEHYKCIDGPANSVTGRFPAFYSPEWDWELCRLRAAKLGVVTFRLFGLCCLMYLYFIKVFFPYTSQNADFPIYELKMGVTTGLTQVHGPKGNGNYTIFSTRCNLQYRYRYRHRNLR